MGFSRFGGAHCLSTLREEAELRKQHIVMKHVSAYQVCLVIDSCCLPSCTFCVNNLLLNDVPQVVHGFLKVTLHGKLFFSFRWRYSQFGLFILQKVSCQHRTLIAFIKVRSAISPYVGVLSIWYSMKRQGLVRFLTFELHHC